MAGTSSPSSSTSSAPSGSASGSSSGETSFARRFIPQGSFGVVFFGGLSLLWTGLHLYTHGPGGAFETFTGLLYTLGAVSLSPVFFYTLMRPMTARDFTFLGLFAGFFLLTAPVYYVPDHAMYGLALGAGGFLAAILPAWFRYSRFQEAVDGLEEGDPRELLEALTSQNTSLRSMARIRLIELSTAASERIIQEYLRLGTRQPALSLQLLDILREICRGIDPATTSPYELSQLVRFWKSQAESSRDFDVLAYAYSSLGILGDVEAAPLLLAALKRELKTGGGVTRGRERMFDALFEGLVACQPAPSEGGAEGIAFSRELTSTMLEFYLIYPSLSRFECLKRMGGPVVASIAAMLQQVSARARLELVRLLGALRAVAALPMLIDLVKDPTSEMRAVAVEGLLEYLPTPQEKGKSSLPDALSKQAAEALMRLANDTEERVRLKAIEGLARVGDGPSLRLLLDFLASPMSPVEDGRMRGNIAAQLGRTGNAQALEPLLRLTEGFDTFAMAGAARGLGFMRDGRVVPRLKALLKHAELEVAVSAAIGLSHAREEGGADVLLKYVKLPQAPVRLEALEALFRQLSDEALPVLEAGIGGPMPGWTLAEREFAISKLLETKIPPALAVLERVWKREDLDEQVVQLMREKLKAAGMLKAAT